MYFKKTAKMIQFFYFEWYKHINDKYIFLNG